MKATELMVGDLVEYSSKYKHGIGKIAGIEPREGSADPTTFTIIDENLMLIGVSRVNIKPIPLTSEILEKNGFKKCAGNEWSVFKYEDDDCTKNALYQVLWSADELYLEISSYTSNTGDFNRIGIRYVHELQHALKLCGIEKTIEL